MKKKLLALFLVAAMIFGLTACGKTSSQTGTTAGDSTTAASEEGTTADARLIRPRLKDVILTLLRSKVLHQSGLLSFFPIRMRETPLISTITPSTEPLMR